MGNDNSIGEPEVADHAEEEEAAAEQPLDLRTNRETYATYIFQVLKQMHPDLGISRQAMIVMNSLVNDLFDRISREAALRSQTGELTIEDIENAVKLLLPGELAHHAIRQGQGAVARYNEHRNVEEDEEDDEEDEGQEGDQQEQCSLRGAEYSRLAQLLPDDDECLQLFNDLFISGDAPSASALSVVEAALEVFCTTGDIDDLKDTLRAAACQS